MQQSQATSAENESGAGGPEHNPLVDDTLDMELHSDPDTSEDEDALVRYTSFHIARDSWTPQFHIGQKFGTT